MKKVKINVIFLITVLLSCTPQPAVNPIVGSSDKGDGTYANPLYIIELNKEVTAPVPSAERRIVIQNLHAPDPITGETPERGLAEGEYDYNGSNLHLAWQLNHNPDNRYWSLTERKGWLRLKAMLNSAVNPGNFYYSYDGANWEKLGDTLEMRYSINNHFMGYRFGLYNFAKTSEGGYVDFDYFRINDKIN